MRIIFAGTPAVAVPSLTALTDHDIAAVVTRPDTPQGRKRVVTSSPVALAAEEHGLPVLKTDQLGSETTAQLSALKADLGVIVAFGGLVNPPLLTAPRYGWINLHFSLLPRWRGAAPVQHAIMAGDELTGATVFILEPDLDSGPLLATVTTAIGADETAGQLLGRLSYDGALLLQSVISGLETGGLTPRPQEGEITFAPKLHRNDARINWSRDARAVYAQIRGVTPEPGAFTEIGSTPLKILSARLVREDTHIHQPTAQNIHILRSEADADPGYIETLPPGTFTRANGRVVVGTASTPLELLEVQPAGKSPMLATHWWNGLGKKTVHAQ